MFQDVLGIISRMLEWIVTLPPEFQASALGATATIIAAAIGFGAIVHQIGRQARVAITQQRDNEAMKLKVDLYRQITETCERATDAELQLTGPIRDFLLHLAIASDSKAAGLPFTIPAGRMPEIIRLRGVAVQAAIEIITTVEHWRIVDPRMAVFQLAINVALRKLDAAWTAFFPLAMRALPMDLSDGSGIFPWEPAGDEARKELTGAAEKLYEAAGQINCWVGDFRDAMQAQLLGDLFGNEVSRRNPPDPAYRLITLEEHAALISYFEHETDEGREMVALEQAARAAHPLSPPPRRSGWRALLPSWRRWTSEG